VCSMNTVNLKNELADIVCRYLKKHPHSRRMLVDAIAEGRGEYMFTLIFISAVKSAKGGKYPQYADGFSEFISYLEDRLCLALDMRAVAKARRIQLRSKLNRLAILMAYLVEAKRTGGFVPPELAVPELALFWAEGGRR
jgi:hypothetical protein